jgi:hypothetical protein
MDDLRVILGQMRVEEQDVLKQRSEEVEAANGAKVTNFRHAVLPYFCHGVRLSDHPFPQRPDRRSGPPRSEFPGRTAIGSESTGVRSERVVHRYD